MIATSSNLTATEDNIKRIDRLFLNFAAMYGHVWRGQFKSDEFLAFAKKEWQEGLAMYSDNILDLARKLCRKTREMPPTLPKFIEFCNYYQPKPSSILPELPRDTRSDIAEENLLKIKQILKMKIN